MSDYPTVCGYVYSNGNPCGVAKHINQTHPYVPSFLVRLDLEGAVWRCGWIDENFVSPRDECDGSPAHGDCGWVKLVEVTDG